MVVLFPVALTVGSVLVLGVAWALGWEPRSAPGRWVCALLDRAVERLAGPDTGVATGSVGRPADVVWTADVSRVDEWTVDLGAQPRPVPGPDGAVDEGPTTGAARAAAGVDRGLVTLSAVRHRLEAVTAELTRLEHDRTAFARAFHTHAAMAAYRALLDDESRLRALPVLDLAPGHDRVPALVLELVDQRAGGAGVGAARREELDL